MGPRRTGVPVPGPAVWVSFARRPALRLSRSLLRPSSRCPTVLRGDPAIVVSLIVLLKENVAMSTTTLPRPLSAPSETRRVGGRMRRLVRGRADDARWARPALIVLLVCTAAAYIWGLSASGNANSFY